MTPAERQTLTYFKDDTTYLNGSPIEWDALHYETMWHLNVLRLLLGSPIRLIRGPHPYADPAKAYKATALDATCPKLPLAQVAMGLMRMQRVSWGVYSGNSFHLDCREFERWPSRWMAIKDNKDEEMELIERGLQTLVTYRADGWLYLSWDHPRSFEALMAVCLLAQHDREA